MRALKPDRRAIVVFLVCCDGVRLWSAHFSFHVLYEGGWDGWVRGLQNHLWDFRFVAEGHHPSDPSQ